MNLGGSDAVHKLFVFEWFLALNAGSFGSC